LPLQIATALSVTMVKPTLTYVSPAPYRKRAEAKEQDYFVGGKICPIGEQACSLGKVFGCVNVKENLK